MSWLRCLGLHRWLKGESGWACRRCGKRAKTCDNCARQHDPNALVIVCTVTVTDWEDA